MTKKYRNNEPTTPTAAAWWALMEEDAPFDEASLFSCGTAGGGENKSTASWLNGYRRTDSSSRQTWPENIASRASTPEFKSSGSISSREDGQTNSETDFLPEVLLAEEAKSNIMNALQCNGLARTKLQQFEGSFHETADRLRPCKPKDFEKFVATNSDEEDDTIYELSEVGSKDSGIRTFGDILKELQEDIPFFQKLTESSRKKYNNGVLMSEAKAKNVPEPEEENPVKRDGNALEETKCLKNHTVISTNEESSLQHRNQLYGESMYFSKTIPSPDKTMVTSNSIGIKKQPSAARKDRGPPLNSVVATNNELIQSVDSIIRGLSTLTGTTESDESSWIQQRTYETDSETKVCMPPVLLKHLRVLKNVKFSRSGSTISSNPSNSPIRVLSSSEEQDNICEKYTYEYHSMKHIYVAFFRRNTKAINSIHLYEHPIPPTFPTLPDEVVVKIEATTVSVTDCKIRRGDIWGENSANALNLPIVPGTAFCGIVTQCHNNKTSLKEGSRVISLVHVGANSRHLCISGDRLVNVPDRLHNASLLACVPEIYLTAFQVIHLGQKNGARYRKTSLSGKSILVLGGTSVFGRALIELAVAGGSHNVYATGKEKDFETIRKAGGAPLGKNSRQWCSILTQKIDLIVDIDNTMGKSELKIEHLELLSQNGKIVLISAPNGERKANEIDVLSKILEKTECQLYFYNVFDSWDENLRQAKRDLTHLLKLMIDKCFKPTIVEKIPLNRVARAQDILETKKLNGFIVCEPWMATKQRSSPNRNLAVASGDNKTKDDSRKTITL
jgi:NADPH:quinone reductase-like Zn-dependent oxidoreductase